MRSLTFFFALCIAKNFFRLSRVNIWIIKQTELKFLAKQSFYTFINSFFWNLSILYKLHYHFRTIFTTKLVNTCINDLCHSFLFA